FGVCTENRISLRVPGPPTQPSMISHESMLKDSCVNSTLDATSPSFTCKSGSGQADITPASVENCAGGVHVARAVGRQHGAQHCSVPAQVRLGPPSIAGPHRAPCGNASTPASIGASTRASKGASMCEDMLPSGPAASSPQAAN